MHALPRTLLLCSLLFLPALALAQTTEVLVASPVPAPDGNGTIISFVSEP